MKWLKNRLYLILLAAVGVIYLSFVDDWQIYAVPFAEAKAWYQSTVQGQPVVSGSVVKQDPGNQDAPDREEGSTVDKDESDIGFGDVDNRTGVENPDGEAAVDGGEGEGPNGEAAVNGGDGEESNGGAAGNGGDDEGANGEGNGFEYSPVPVYVTVEDDYFTDALFIGDSRTVGMYEYGGLEEITTFYASKGLTIYKLFSSEVVEVPGQRKKKTIEEALQENQFNKIYLMVGINEMGTGTVETFAEAYGEVVEHLLELQPDAIIYIQGILKVTTERSGKGDYINNEGIVARNEAISKLADDRRVFYLDVNPLLCDDTGGMEPSYTFDGVHLKAQYIEIWKDYLKTHAISFE